MVKKCFLSVWLFLCFTLLSGVSFADTCGHFAKKNGFGFIDTSSLICKTDRYEGQTCRRSKFSDPGNFLYTSQCKLEGNFEWVGKARDFDYSITAGMFSTYKLKSKTVMFFCRFV